MSNSFRQQLNETARWVAEHADELLGRPVELAVEQVRAAGLVPSIRRRGRQYTLQGRTNRVKLLVDDHDILIRVHAG